MSVTRQSFAHSLLAGLALPITNRNLQILVAWQEAEGGAGPQFGVAGNIAAYNPLNSTLPLPGSQDTPGNGASPVQAYASWSQGLQATIQTLSGSNMHAIVSMLQTGNALPTVAASTIDNSPWGTKSLTAASINGAAVSANDLGTIISGTLAEGVFGAGGSGTAANTINPSLWVVGTSQNPDQDYWTTINQYAMQAQWYLFSDGETLYAADGIKLMGQTPSAVIVLYDPHVISADLTYDNTAFQATHTSLKRGNVIRRATLARVTSPTECEIKLICPIDTFRAGETVILRQFGEAADGIWLIGEVRRSLFEIYSTLTLVQAMQPLNANSGLPLGPQYTAGAAAAKPGSGTVLRAIIDAADQINNEGIPYEWGGGHAHAGTPSGSPLTGFDCSGAVAAVLYAAGLWPPTNATGDSVPTSNELVNELLQAGGVLAPGQGSGKAEVTLFDNPDHIYMRIDGHYWQFGGPDGVPGGWFNGAVYPGFRITHILPSVLGQQVTGNTLGG